jgi:hypothetical protein
MPRFEIQVKSRPSIEAPTFSAEQMRQIGEHAIQVMKNRLHAGVDVLDQPARPLGEKYAKRKARLGKQPIRDILLTGNTLGSVQVTESGEGHVKVSIKGATPFRKAIFNQNQDPWFGLSDTDDERLLGETIAPIFAQNVSAINAGIE